MSQDRVHLFSTWEGKQEANRMLVTNPLPQPRPRGPPREKLPATKDPGTGCENLQESCRFCSLGNMGTPPPPGDEVAPGSRFNYGRRTGPQNDVILERHWNGHEVGFPFV